MPNPPLLLQAHGELLGLPRAVSTGLIAHAGWVAKIVLLILLIFSAISWAIIFYKIWCSGAPSGRPATFLEVFRKSAKFSEVQAVCPTLAASPLVGLFQAGYAELNTQLRSAGATGQAGRRRGASYLKSLDAVDRALLRATTVEIGKLETACRFSPPPRASRRTSDCSGPCGAS